MNGLVEARRDIESALVEIGQVLDVCAEEFSISSVTIQELILADAQRAFQIAEITINSLPLASPYSSVDPQADRPAVVVSRGEGSTLSLVVAAIAECTGIAPEAILGTSRVENVVLARQMAYALVAELCSVSISQVGRLFRKDHGTISYGMQSLQDRLDTDRSVAALFSEIRKKLRL